MLNRLNANTWNTMEYTFKTDFITGQPNAQFSFGHEAFGPWLEQEIGQNIENLDRVEAFIAELLLSKQSAILEGKEYSLFVDNGDVEVAANANQIDHELPESLLQDVDDFEQNSIATCGVEDFSEMLQSWRHFNNL